MALNINIHTVPAYYQRYDTIGDWYENYAGILNITVSEGGILKEKGDWRHEMLVAIHELVEYSLCKAADIPQEIVDEFDESRRYALGVEPGDLPDAPYRLQHRQAMLIEHLLANFLGLTDYGKVE